MKVLCFIHLTELHRIILLAHVLMTVLACGCSWNKSLQDTVSLGKQRLSHRALRDVSFHQVSIGCVTCCVTFSFLDKMWLYRTKEDRVGLLAVLLMLWADEVYLKTKEGLFFHNLHCKNGNTPVFPNLKFEKQKNVQIVEKCWTLSLMFKDRIVIPDKWLLVDRCSVYYVRSYGLKFPGC